MPAGESELVVRRRAGDDTRAHDLADLDRGEAGAAGGAEHDQRFAGFEVGAFLQRVERGAVSDGQTGGAVEIEPVGHFHQLLRRDGDGFARRAPADIAHDAVARRDAGDAGADAFDHAGKLRRRRERKRRLVLIFAGDDQRIEEIQRRRFHPHHRFAGAGMRLLDVGELKFIGGAEMAAEDGLHARFISGFRHSGIMATIGSALVRCAAGVPAKAARIAPSQRPVLGGGYLIPYSNELD